jgi:hypothetical protein
VYDLNAGFTQANELTGFHAGFGGAFHVGVEVYGGEWSYGVAGVCCELPRSNTGHTYKCSVIVGNTELDRKGVAEVLKSLVDGWHGAGYDTLGHNCLKFATKLCERLGCGELPTWVDRLPNMLHGGKQAGIGSFYRMQSVAQETSQYAQELHSKAQPHFEYAANLGSQMLVASRDAMRKADQHTQTLLATLWESVQSNDTTQTSTQAALAALSCSAV